MITEAPFFPDLRPALACVKSRLERTSRWLKRWMIHGSFALYLVNWEIRSAADFQPSITRLPELPELTDPRVITALTFTQPANQGGRFLARLHE
jgi:hypothetical protein